MNGFICLICTALAIPLTAADWPYFRGTNRDGISPETGWFRHDAKLQEHWRVQVGLGFSGASVVSNRLYTAGYANKKDSIRCLNANTGTTNWTVELPSSKGALFYQGGTSATPTIANGRAYHFTRSGILIALDAPSGKILWQTNLVEHLKYDKPTWGFASSPVVLGDRVILNAGESATAFSAADGKLIWRSGRDNAGYSTPVPFALAGAPHVALLSLKELVAVAAKDGSVAWRQRFKAGWGQAATDAVIDGKKLFISGHSAKGKQFNLLTGEEIAGFKSGIKTHFNAGVLLRNHLFMFSGKAHSKRSTLECMSWASGESTWSHTGLGAGALTVADGKLIILSEDGRLLIAEAHSEEFKPLFEQQLLPDPVWTPPTLAHGKIYARSGKGDLVCISFP